MTSKRTVVICSVAGSALLTGCLLLWRRKRRLPGIFSRLSGSTGYLTPSSIHLITNNADWNAVYPLIRQELEICKVLGFDCEWVSLDKRGNRPVSLVQLATPAGRCVLIRIMELEGRLPKTLSDLLADRTILKVGVGCLGDANKLLKDHAVTVLGCVDLRHLVARTRIKTTGYSLKKLSLAALDLDLEKNILIRASNWELNPLTQEQINYAAMDALVGVRIFLVMLNKKLGLPAYRKHTVVSDRDTWAKAQSLCQGVVDTKYSYKKYDDIYVDRESPSPSPSRPRSTRTPPRGASTSAMTRAYSRRQRPLYYNCQLRAMDGQLLCTCDIKKAQWYMEKGLGVKIADDPITIQLTFEPTGRPLEEKQNYYLQDKDNVCVVCGDQESYIRANIVPQEYRKNFPPVLKEHRSHDIVLMCPPCHQKYNFYVQRLKHHLAVECDAPIAAGMGTKYTTDFSLSKVKSAAKALLKSSSTIPEPRLTELRRTVQDYYGVTELGDDLLVQAADMDTKQHNADFVSHSKRVIKHQLEHDGLVAFERQWRQNFIDTMAPKHLPAMWSVDHSHDELADMGESLVSAVNRGEAKKLLS